MRTEAHTNTDAHGTGRFCESLDVRLDHQAIYRVPDAADMRIVCRSGSVWVTLDDDPRDVVLSAGESFTTPDHRRALIYAIEPSRVSVALPSSQQAAPAHSVRPAGFVARSAVPA